MRRRLIASAVLALVAGACSSGLGSPVPGSSSGARKHAVLLPPPAGPALPASQARRTVQLSFEGGYQRWLTIVEASRSVPQGEHEAVVWLPGLGTVTVRCTARPHATFGFTSWAKGEGPPRLTSTSVPVHGVTLATGLLRHPRSLVPPPARHISNAEARHQVLAQLRFDGGGEAFQFWVNVVLVLTPTTSRCDVLAEARVLTTGAFKRYAPGHRLY